MIYQVNLASLGDYLNVSHFEDTTIHTSHFLVNGKNQALAANCHRLPAKEESEILLGFEDTLYTHTHFKNMIK